MNAAADERRASSTDAPLAMTMGDPSGIGPDIALMAWAHRRNADIPPFALYADPDLIAQRAALLGIDVSLAVIASAADAIGAFGERLPLVPIELPRPALPGAPAAENARAIIASIERAATDAADHKVSAIVTNPIAKSVLYAVGFTHPGHTEYLGELALRHWPGAAVRPMMLLVADRDDVILRVAPLTIHIPLRDVASQISTASIVAAAQTLAEALFKDFGVSKPRIAIAGLNPHAGEGGAIGVEDRDVIAPAIRELQALGLNVTGPHSADTMFHSRARARYDAVIAMYHDQALIPVKTLAFDFGVNVTLGLPFIRTSPDHGTAFDIAGTGRASASSLVAALQLARRMVDRRAAALAR
jgi:4-hydroxythreonine-4-phosphate dehydrogenase